MVILLSRATAPKPFVPKARNMHVIGYIALRQSFGRMPQTRNTKKSENGFNCYND